jgi:SAF domain-containing protein
VPDLPTPSAARLARARWLDTRLLLGVLLVLVSVVVGAKILAEADDTVRVWSVKRDLGADTTLAATDLVSRSVRLPGAAGRYVSAAEDLDGLVLRRPLGKGELVPLSAVSPSGAADLRRVVIEVDRFGAAGLRKGGVVDVYAVRTSTGTTGTEQSTKPQLVLAGVTVAENVDSGARSFSGTGARAGVTLSVARADVPTVIDAVAHGTVYVVQVPLPAARDAGTAPSPVAAP